MLHGAAIDERQLYRGLGPRTRRTWTPLARALMATGDQWTLMIIVALAPGRMRVNNLQRQLPGVSAGVLARHLQQMVAIGLVTRTRFKEMPPRVELELTEAGRELLPVAGAVARWGASFMWTEPQDYERVDLDVLLRLLPFMLDDDTILPRGAVEVVVEDADRPVHYCFRVEQGYLRLDDHGEDLDVATWHEPRSTRKAASLQGERADWIAALGPDGDCTGLRMFGDERLGRRMLDALGRPLRRGLPQWVS